MTTDLEEDSQETSGAGAHSVAGYDYQVDVSVWLALDLVLANKLTHEIVLEPSSQEDLETELSEFEPGRLTNTIPMSGYRLMVQAKRRTGDAWTVKAIAALLRHGKARPSAAKRLADPNVRYLLVTSASLNGGTRGLRVRHAGIWPKAGDMPLSIEKMLGNGAAGRVAIIGDQDDERLSSDIKKLLTEGFRVPNARWEECRAALRQEARIRIRGAGSGRWQRPELETVIRKHDGYIASSPELEHYVHPTNWADLRFGISDRHAALIVGQSGTGKTLATKKLFEELRATIPGLSRVAVTLGPQQLRDDVTDPPVLYDIEDPWGRFDFDPASRPWNDQLAQIFSHARHDRMIVATSRLDVAEQAGVLPGMRRWLVALDAEHYGAQERLQLYRTRIGSLPRHLQVIATEAEERVLAELATPLEIQKFFDAIPTLDPAGLANPQGFIKQAIGQSHQDSIERTVIDQIEQRDDVRAAAVVWGLLKANGKLSFAALRQIEERLADREPNLAKGVSPLVRFFITARNLRQSEPTVTYYHPRVESGIEQALTRNALVTRRTLRLLVDVLLTLDGPGEDWGTATAVRLVAATDQVRDLKPSPSQNAQAILDTWISDALASGGDQFRANLRLAAATGSAASRVSEAVRFLLHRPDRSFGGMWDWGPPEHDDAWYAQLRADPAVRTVIETFIKRVLPHEHAHFGGDFVTEVERLAPNLSEAFLAAAYEAVHFGVMSTSDAIAEGAVRDLDGFERIVDAAIAVLTPTDAEQREAETLHLAIVNDEYSEDYAEHLANDDGYTAGEFLDAYVHQVRITRGWHHLAQHRHRDRLLFYWLRSLANDATTRAEEVDGAFAAAFGTRDEATLWHILVKAWGPRYLPSLESRLLKGHLRSAVRVAALECLVERVPAHLTAISQGLVDQGNHARLVEIAIELGELRHRRFGFDREHHSVAAETATTGLPTTYAEITEAASALATKRVPSLNKEARDLLAGVEGGSSELRSFRVRLDQHIPLPVLDDIHWLLANSDESDIAVHAIEAAIRNGMTAEIDASLSHRFAHVVAHALKAIATPLTPPLPTRILSLANAKGSPVRRVLVELLDTKPHANHLQALLRLVRDHWSSNSDYNAQSDEYPIAQAAVPAIEKLGFLALETADELYEIATKSRDPVLRSRLLTLLARAAGPSFQERLFALAAAPGVTDVRRAAAASLLRGHEGIAPEVVVRITPELLTTCLEPVASRLSLLLAARGHLDAVIEAAEALATNDKRRVLLLLLVWVLTGRDRTSADKVADMLPPDHPAIAWARGSDTDSINELVLEDLGDPLNVAEVLYWINQKKG